LLLGGYNAKHEDAIEKNQHIFKTPPATQYHDHAAKTHLLGRVGLYNKQHYVSFWNEDPELYKKLLKPCLEELKKLKLITNATRISTPIHKICTVGEEIALTDNPQSWKDQLAQHMTSPMGKLPVKLPTFLKPKTSYARQADLKGIVGIGESFSFREWVETQ
jgi:hypothetical protein